MTQVRGGGGVVEDGLQLCGELMHPAIVEAGVAESLPMLGDVIGDDHAPASHRLDQGGMRPPHLRGLDVGHGVRLEDSISVPIDRAEKPDARTSIALQPLDVLRRVRRVADDRQGKIRPHLAECLHHGVRVVLRLQPAHVQDVPVRLQSQGGQGAVVRDLFEVRPVGKVLRATIEPPPIVVLDHKRVGDDVDGEASCQPGAGAIVDSPERIPLASLPLQPIDVQHHHAAECPEEHDRRDIRRVADVQHVVVPGEGMRGCYERMHDGFEVLGVRGRQSNDPHPEVFPLASRNGCGPPVDGDHVAALDQSPTELLGECLEAAVARGNPADSQEGDAHVRR